MKKIFKLLLFSLLLISLVLSTFFLYMVISTKNIKFNPSNLTKNLSSVTFYDENGEQIILTSGKSEITTDIPSHVKNAFISVEDKRFYSHNGLDVKRILGAMLVNVKKGSFSQGASTISQQLIKNTHLSSEKTFKRKFAEIKLTRELEKNYSKDEILSLYLNNIYFGENCYGIKNASEKYFDKSPSELTVSEGALLAGIIKAPSKYNPIANFELAIKRRDLVLKLMRENFIDESTYKKALNEKITIKNVEKSGENEYFNQVEKELREIMKTPYFTKNIRVYTYLNQNIQDNISKISCDYKSDKAFLIINNNTMGVQAYYSTCGEILRSPGSTIKPLLVYAPCYEEKIINLQTKILDEPTDFNGYTPKNYGDKYYGYISAKECLSKSLNVPSVKLLNSLTVEKAKKYANKMNITTKDENLSLALGSLTKGISLRNLTSCYAMLANNGNFSQARFIKEIKNEKGQTIYRHKTQKNKVFSEETAYLINYNLMDCVINGTSKKLKGLPYEVCAKTGTNGNINGNFDAYNISYTTEHSVGVWIGNKNNELMDNKVTGSTYPTLISKQIYEHLYKNKSPRSFNVPENIIKVNIDKASYEKSYEIKLANGLEFIEGIFIKGTEPKTIADNKNIPNIKDYKIYCNINNISLFYDLDKADGILLYEIKKNKKLVKKIYGNSYSFKVSYGKHNYKIIPFREENGAIIYGNEIIVPEINIQKEIPKEWWRD